MSRSVNAEGVRRGEYFWIPPEQVLPPLENSRGFSDPEGDEAAIRGLMESLREKGQLQPVRVHQLPDRRVRLTAGGRRREALIRLNATLPPEQQMLLQCIVVTENEEESFLHNLEENVQRRALSDMDIALAARKLIERYGKTPEEVGRMFPKENGEPRSRSWVDQHLDLLTLDHALQVKVHRGELGVAAALALVRNVAEEAREEVFEAASKNRQSEQPKDGQQPGKKAAPKAREIIAAARERGALTKKVGRKIADIRDDLIAMTGPGEPKPVREFAEAFLTYLDGTTEWEEFEETIFRLLAVEVPKRRKEALKRK